MFTVRTKEEQAAAIARSLDDIITLPGVGLRMGIDPVLGLIPVIGDALATLLGGAILVRAPTRRALGHCDKDGFQSMEEWTIRCRSGHR